MSALTTSRNTPERVSRSRQFEADGTIYCGGLVAVNSSGKAVAASDSAGLQVVGRAEHNALSGEKISVCSGCFAYDGSSFTKADIGKMVYVSDDQTVAKSSTNKVIAGAVFDVDSNGVWINVGLPAIPAHTHVKADITDLT